MNNTIALHPSPAETFTYIVEQWLAPGPGAGHWYECRRVTAADRTEAKLKAFNEPKIPQGYRLRLA